MVLMTDIKETIEKLATDWTWTAVKEHRNRHVLIKVRRFRSLTVKVPHEFGEQHFDIRHEPEKGKHDLRIWTKTQGGLLQWRTCPVKGDRLVYVKFGGQPEKEKVALEDIFLDPLHVDEGEVEFFKVMYPDLVKLLRLFSQAVDLVDQKIEDD